MFLMALEFTLANPINFGEEYLVRCRTSSNGPDLKTTFRTFFNLKQVLKRFRDYTRINRISAVMSFPIYLETTSENNPLALLQQSCLNVIDHPKGAANSTANTLHSLKWRTGQIIILALVRHLGDLWQVMVMLNLLVLPPSPSQLKRGSQSRQILNRIVSENV
jgi:hypothetical protein